MIVIEGFDCSGKSTLATRLSNAIGWPVLHTGGPTHTVDDVVACLSRSRLRWRRRIIQDRITHVSESVYSHLSYPLKSARALDAIAQIPSNVLMIYCRPPPGYLLNAILKEHRRESWDSAEHMSRVLRDAPGMIAFYDTVMAMVALRCNVHVYDRLAEPDAESIIALAKERFL